MFRLATLLTLSVLALGCSPRRDAGMRSGTVVSAEIDPRSDSLVARWPGLPMLPDGRFPIAAWVAPPASETTDARYAEYAAAGFTVALFGLEDRFEEHSNRARLDVAARHGVYVIPRDGRVHPDEAERAGWRADIDSVVQAYAAHPALLGYFLADEPSRATFRSIGVLTRHFALADSMHPTYVNLIGLSPRGYGPDGLPYSRWLDAFLSEVRPAFFSIDHYTLRMNGESPQLAAGLDTVAQVAARHGVPFWSVLQLTPHADFRELTEAELRYQANLSLAYGARGIVWFTYWTPNPAEDLRYRGGPISHDGKRNPSYERVARVNAEVQVLGGEMSSLAWRTTRHAGRMPTGVAGPDGSEWLRWISGGDVAIGFFENAGGRGYALIMSREFRREGSVHVAAASGLERWTGRPGEYVRMTGRDGSRVYDLPLPAGGAALVREAR